MPTPSPLHEITSREGASFIDCAGWLLPAHFGNALQEYRNTCAGASIFDRSNEGKLEVRGTEAPQFLHNLSTNDIKKLPLGAGCEAYFCDQRAKVLGQALIYHVRIEGNQDAFWLDVTAGYAEKLLKHLDKHLIAEQVELADRTAAFAQIHLAGPKATEILEKAVGDSIPALGEFQHMERTFALNATCHIRRHDLLGYPGYDLVCLNSRAEGIWPMLVAAGAQPAGLDSFEILRIEAGAPIYGIDIDETRFVIEVAQALRAVSYNKGCFLGQEPIVMARDRAGHVNRAFLLLKVLPSQLLPASTKLFRDGSEVGLITSSIESPKYGGVIALGYVRRGHQDPGTQLEAQIATGKVGVEVIRSLAV